MHTAITPVASLSQQDLDIAIKTRSNPITWNGQFSPQLVRALIAMYAPAGAVVVDPFAGSATVAGESIALGHSFVGFEVNPAAFILGSLYALAPHEVAYRKVALKRADDALSSLGACGLSDDATINLQRVRSLEWTRHRSANVAVASILMNAFRSSESTTIRELRRARDRVTEMVLGLRVSNEPVSIRMGDARATQLSESSCDLVVTSPPYINVFNYHQQYRPVVEALGCRPLSAAGSEIGANRKFRQNRFLTVIQYCLDIGASVAEMFRVCRRGGRVVMIVGRESSVLGVPFKNGELVCEVVRRAFGIEPSLRQERKFVNRFGQLIYEDVLHFDPIAVEYAESGRAAARAVALEALHTGLSVVGAKSLPLLRTACLNGAHVQSSPLFRGDGNLIPLALCAQPTK